MNPLLCVLLVVCVAQGLACKCATPSQKDVWTRSDVVAKVKITKKETSGHTLVYTGNYLATFKHSDLTNIAGPVTLKTASVSAACGVTELKVDEEYLITASQDGSTLRITTCNGMPDKDNSSYPLGALEWSRVDSDLLNKLKSGKF